ncbi:universal stress protein [Rhodococcus sp. YH3-3]|nr:universal stress protein [Rhodococcus sp. YH3-3]MBX9152284.1 universal stress protein [Rhodococcus qingshengii]
MTHSPHIHDTVRSPLTSHLGQSRPQMATTRHVVVGFGTGDISKNALAFAAGQDADVHVVHCVDSEDMPIETDSPQYENRFQHAVAAQRDHAVAALQTFPGAWTYDCVRADPAEYLLKSAKEYGAFVIVVGAPRTGAVSALGALLHTSVSSRLTRQDQYPVLLIPAAVTATAWPPQVR